MTQDIMLKVSDVAERCGVSQRTVRRIIHAGVLPATKIGNQYIVAADDLDHYLARARLAKEKAR